MNQKTLNAWTGHPHLSIIANIKGESFNDKMAHSVRAVEETVGLEMVDVSHEKFLIKARNLFILLSGIPCRLESVDQ